MDEAHEGASSVGLLNLPLEDAFDKQMILPIQSNKLQGDLTRNKPSQHKARSPWDA